MNKRDTNCEKGTGQEFQLKGCLNKKCVGKSNKISADLTPLPIMELHIICNLCSWSEDLVKYLKTQMTIHKPVAKLHQGQDNLSLLMDQCI